MSLTFYELRELAKDVSIRHGYACVVKIGRQIGVYAGMPDEAESCNVIYEYSNGVFMNPDSDPLDDEETVPDINVGNISKQTSRVR